MSLEFNGINCLILINICLLVSRSAEARVHSSLGYVYELLQDIDKAIDHYEQVYENNQSLQQYINPIL